MIGWLFFIMICIIGVAITTWAAYETTKQRTVMARLGMLAFTAVVACLALIFGIATWNAHDGISLNDCPGRYGQDCR